MQWARLAITGVTVVVCAVACADVLDIEDPKVRPAEAGASGEPTAGAPDSGGSNSASGNGGAATLGATDHAGETVGGNAPDGGAGAAAKKDCQPNAIQCGGRDAKSPQICDATGHWVVDRQQAEGACPASCAAGKCTACEDGDKRCTVCQADAADCDTNLPQTCVAGIWTNDKKSCAQYCDGEGECMTAPSCDVINTHRTTCNDGVSCCKSLLVPGGSFKRDFDDSDDYGDDSFVAQISPFLLDKFEVTVGRVRQFVNAYTEVLTTTLKPGAGKSPHITNDAGWNSDFVMPATKEALLTELTSCSVGTTWSDDVTANNDLPLNCVSFNVAYAFCIWDGGRLPTEAEWNFAAAGGRDQRVYPWAPSVSGPEITDDYANYGDTHPGPLAVGSKPRGNGRWGHADLAGNVMEWVLDYFGAYPSTCTDCLNTTASPFRSQRGGAYSMPSDALFVAVHTGNKPLELRPSNGFRCARDPK